MTHDTTPSPDAVGPQDGDDAELDGLMLRLRDIADRFDAPPPIVTDLARAAFETRDLDAELAVLTADSAVDTLALVRSAVIAPRMVSFETASVGVELEISDADGHVEVRGLITGPDSSETARVEIHVGAVRRPVPVDAAGWFQVRDLPVGALRVRIAGLTGGAVTTPWIAT